MKRGKSIALLSIIGVLMAVLIVLTFVRFPIGVKIYKSVLGTIDLDYDMVGGYAYDLTFSDKNEDEIQDKKALENDISSRLSALGYQVYSVKRIESTDATVDDYKIRIELKGTANVGNDIGAVAMFGKVRIFGGSDSGNLSEILTDVKAIDKASYIGSVYHQDVLYQNFSIKFTKEARDFLDKEITGSYYLKITAGEDEGDYSTTLLDTTSGSEPFSIQDSYKDGTLSLSYGSDEDVVKRLVMQLNYGGLDYKFEVGDGAKITSPFGENISTICLIIVSCLLLAVVVYFAVTNRGYGIVVILSLVLFIVAYLFMFIAVPNITINLGGVLGIIAAIILTSDGFMIIAKRINEEYANGKTVKAAMKSGFRRAFFPTLASVVISIAVSALLFAFTKGIVRGFAITFGIGSVISFIATVVFSRMFNNLILPLVKMDRQDRFFNLKREDK